jgi:hypothetical protein
MSVWCKALALESGALDMVNWVDVGLAGSAAVAAADDDDSDDCDDGGGDAMLRLSHNTSVGRITPVTSLDTTHLRYEHPRVCSQQDGA